MRLVLLILFIRIALTPCFSQSISDTELSDSIKSFWSTLDNSGTIVKPTFRKFNFENKQVVFFGTNHSIKDTSNPMFTQIAKEINNLDPTLILTEGYSVLLDSKDETTRFLGDYGVCTYSGYERGIRVKSWDMPLNDLYYGLQKEFSENELYTLMVIQNLDSAGTSFSNFISDLEIRGWPFRPEQKSRKFFLKQYKRYFNIPVEITNKNFNLPDVSNTPRLKKYYTLSQQLRDKHLIKTLKESLKLNDRVFIQAGALHLMSLQKIIPFILKDSKTITPLENEGDNTSTNFLPDINSSNSFSIEKISDGEKRIILFGSNYNVHSDDSQYSAIKKEITNLKPDLVLTQGFDPLYASKKQAGSESRVAGFCRYLGISEGIRVTSWEPSWNEVYYTLNKKYKTEDIYFSLLCSGILSSQDIIDVNSVKDLAIKTLKEFASFGYPLTIKEDEEFDLFKSITEYLGRPVFGIFGTPIAASRNPDGGNIELKNDGSYKFTGTKEGSYTYNVPITGVKGPLMVPLKITAPAASFVEISGSLLPASSYMPVEEVKEILQECIKQNIVNDLHLIKTAYLLKQLKEYKKQYNRIFIQGDRKYINFIKANLNKEY